VVLVIVSRESLASQNVKTEVHLARQHEKNVLPILLGFSTEEVQTAIPDDWSYLLGISQSVEYSAVLEDHATLVDALAELEVFPQLPRPATAADKNTINAHERFAPERDAGEGSSGTPWPDGAIVGDVPPSATQVPFPMAAPQNQPPPGPTTPA
jgi:hypothetical protein